MDTLYEDTYLALLANVLIYMYKIKPSKWRDDLINQIFHTTKIVYAGTERFENYLQKLLAEPQQAYLQKEDEYEDYVATSKPFIYLFFAMMAGNLIKDFESEIEKIILYFFYREQHKHQFDLNFYLRLKLPENDEKAMQQALKSQFEKYVSLSHFKKAVDEEVQTQYLNQFKNNNTYLTLAEDKVYNKDLRLTLDAVEAFYEQFAGKKFDTQRYFALIYHSYTVPVEQMFVQKVKYEVKEEILQKMLGAKDVMVKKGTAKSRLAIEREYTLWFIRTHMMVEPMTYEKLKQECADRNIDVSTIAYNLKSGLSSNCCFAKNCPFYL